MPDVVSVYDSYFSGSKLLYDLCLVFVHKSSFFGLMENQVAVAIMRPAFLLQNDEGMLEVCSLRALIAIFDAVCITTKKASGFSGHHASQLVLMDVHIY